MPVAHWKQKDHSWHKMNIILKIRAPRGFAQAVLFLFIACSTAFSRIHRSVSETRAHGRHCYLARQEMTLLWDRVMSEPKAVFVPDWEKAKMLSQSRIKSWFLFPYHSPFSQCLRSYPIKTTFANTISLQNIFTIKSVSGHKIKTDIKMFRPTLHCRFIWLQEQDLLYISQVLNTFFRSFTEKCRIFES